MLRALSLGLDYFPRHRKAVLDPHRILWDPHRILCVDPTGPYGLTPPVLMGARGPLACGWARYFPPRVIR